MIYVVYTILYIRFDFIARLKGVLNYRLRASQGAYVAVHITCKFLYTIKIETSPILKNNSNTTARIKYFPHNMAILRLMPLLAVEYMLYKKLRREKDD